MQYIIDLIENSESTNIQISEEVLLLAQKESVINYDCYTPGFKKKEQIIAAGIDAYLAGHLIGRSFPLSRSKIYDAVMEHNDLLGVEDIHKMHFSLSSSLLKGHNPNPTEEELNDDLKRGICHIASKRDNLTPPVLQRGLGISYSRAARLLDWYNESGHEECERLHKVVPLIYLS